MGKVLKVKIPATRDPFVNAQLVPAGIDRKTGEERFWASTWNSNSGCIGALVTPTGKNKIFRFDYDKKQFGYYGASYGGNDIMWLSGFLDEVMMLDLESGETKSWKTGLPHDLSASGLVYDSVTKKVFSAAYCMGDLKRKAFSFNTQSESVAATYEDIPLKNNQLRYSIRNNDGTYTFINAVPYVELLWWDPVNEKIEVISENFETENIGDYWTVVRRGDGAIYIPHYGWFDPILRKFAEGPMASREATWFALKDNMVYGAEYSESGNSTLYKWNMDTGKITRIIEIPDASTYNLRLTSDGQIVCINMYGYFYRINPDTCAIECSIKLETDAVGHIDCLYRINEERLLGTPFITQRFYEINLKTGEECDLGRATGGCGEVLKVKGFEGKIYMASYTKGQLVEYDPNLPANFPENPRVVVHPPQPAMRPVALCCDSESIYYSCSHEYGFLGSMLIKYTPAKGVSEFADNPVPDRMIRSMFYDEKSGSIIAGTTYQADCNSCVPKTDRCVLARIDAKSLKTAAVIEAPDTYENAVVCGLLKDNTYLCSFMGGINKKLWKGLDAGEFKYCDYSLPEELNKYENINVLYAGKPGHFVVIAGDSIELWDLALGAKIKKICDASGYYNIFLQDSSMYLVYRQEIHIYEDCI